MSNRNAAEKAAHRKPKVSLAMKINQGLGGPNSAGERQWKMDSWLIFQPSGRVFQQGTRSAGLSALLDLRRWSEDFSKDWRKVRFRPGRLKRAERPEKLEGS